MKGSIANCLKETIVSKYGQQKWDEIMIASGQKPNMTILVTMDIEDSIIVDIVMQACKITNSTLEQVGDLFGEYWMNTYAIKLYKPYYGINLTAREFLLKLNEMHGNVTKTIPNARPPKFEFNWINEKNLIITYISKRGLIDFVVGLTKGVGKYFNQKMSVRKISNTQVEVLFL